MATDTERLDCLIRNFKTVRVTVSKMGSAVLEAFEIDLPVGPGRARVIRTAIDALIEQENADGE